MGRKNKDKTQVRANALKAKSPAKTTGRKIKMIVPINQMILSFMSRMRRVESIW